MPKPEIGAVGFTFAESEVRHMDAYAHLLEILGLNEEFKKIKEYILLKTNDNWVKIDDILPKNAHFTLQLYKEVIRFMLDEKLLQTNEKNEIKSV